MSGSDKRFGENVSPVEFSKDLCIFDGALMYVVF